MEVYFQIFKTFDKSGVRNIIDRTLGLIVQRTKLSDEVAGQDLDRILAERGAKVDAVISLAVEESILRERIKGRAIIEGRADDASDEVVTNRINTYHEKTEPLIGFYKEKGVYLEVNGDGGPGQEGKDRVYSRIKAKLQSKGL